MPLLNLPPRSKNTADDGKKSLIWIPEDIRVRPGKGITPPPPDPGSHPLEGEFQDIPTRLSGFTEWDSVQVVQQAILQLEYGMFQNASLLADSVSRDDRVMAVMNTYINGLVGLPMMHIPEGGADATAKAEKVANDVGHEWPTMVPQDQLKRWLFNGEMLGLGIGELIWKKTSSKWTPTLKVHHNQFCYYNWGTRCYNFITQNGQVELIPGDSHWALYMPGGYHYGWMFGLLRSIWMQWLIRQYAYRDWARYSEVHGLPIRGAIMPAEASLEEKKAFLQDVAACGAETAIALRQSKDGDKFDLKLVEATANSHESFDKLVQRCEESIAIRVLGQNLSTQVRGGSFAAAQVHENVRQDIKQAFSHAASKDARNQITIPYVRYNYGDENLTPQSTWDTVPPADAVQEANKLDVVATALVNLSVALVAVDVKKICAQYKIPLDLEKYPDGKLPPPPVDPAGGGSKGPATPRRVLPPPNPGKQAD